MPGGGTERVSTTATDRLCLTAEQTRRTGPDRRRVERHFGAPQDIEWAFDAAGKLWLTQSRPITTLYPLPDRQGPPGLRVYFCFSVAQGLYRPITPMGLAAFRVLISGVAHAVRCQPRAADPLDGPPQYVEAGQRVFFDLTGVVRSRVGRAVMPRVFDLMETRSATDHAGPVRPARALGHPAVAAAGHPSGGQDRRAVPGSGVRGAGADQPGRRAPAGGPASATRPRARLAIRHDADV